MRPSAPCGSHHAQRVLSIDLTAPGGIFNNDAVLTSALPDRLLQHAETVRIEGKSYRSKDQVEV